MPTTSREALQNAYDAEPHYVVHVNENWHSAQYQSKADAQAWLNSYRVTQTYKDQNYRIVRCAEYWERRNGFRRKVYAL